MIKFDLDGHNLGTVQKHKSTRFTSDYYHGHSVEFDQSVSFNTHRFQLEAGPSYAISRFPTLTPTPVLPIIARIMTVWTIWTAIMEGRSRLGLLN